jgi:lipopolysaccharide transport system permease protein
LGNPNFVKKVVFPLEILPWMSVVSALFQLLVSLTAWLLFCLAIRGVPPWTIVLLPLTLLPLVLLTLGVSWTLASLGVFVRDAGQVVGMVCTALMFLSPVFYDAAAVPERWRWLLDLNPLTYPVEQARHLLLDGQVPDAAALGLQLGAGALVAWAGLAWFQRTRGGFADVI